MIMPTEPSQLKHWRLQPENLKFYTCARPGRSKGSKGDVPDKMLHEWVEGLPVNSAITVVSLLGQKPATGRSEWSFYNFHKEGRTFQWWLNLKYPAKAIQILEHPTTDMEPISGMVMEAIARDVRSSLSEGRTVIIMDSGGVTRTRAVCEFLEAVSAGLF